MKRYIGYKHMGNNTIPETAQRVIHEYEYLRVKEGKTVRCPYFRNPRSGKDRWGLNAFSGKGSPEEIEYEMPMIEKLERKDFLKMREEEIRDIMRKWKLGIECSGFLSHVLDAWVHNTTKKRIFQVLRFPSQSLWAKLASFLRPFAH